MQHYRRRRPLAAWIAILAVLLAALVPAVSRALAATTPAGWTQVCSADGAKWVPSDAEGSQHAPADHTLEHCPYCSLHAPELGLPPVPAQALPVCALPAQLPPAFLAAPRTLHAWVSAQPRAPPRHS